MIDFLHAIASLASITRRLSLDGSAVMIDRPLYQPTPTEMQAACETLLRSAMPREARRVVREIYENLERNNGTENHQSI